MTSESGPHIRCRCPKAATARRFARTGCPRRHSARPRAPVVAAVSVTAARRGRSVSGVPSPHGWRGVLRSGPDVADGGVGAGHLHRPAGRRRHHRTEDPRRGAVVQGLRRDRRDHPGDAAHPAGGQAGQGLGPGHGAGRGQGGRRGPGDRRPPVRPSPDRPAPGRRSAGRDGHHHPRRPGHTAGGPARAGRRDRHPVRPGRGRRLRRDDRRRVRVGPRQARRGPGLGRASGHPPAGLLRLLGQLL